MEMKFDRPEVEAAMRHWILQNYMKTAPEAQDVPGPISGQMKGAHEGYDFGLEHMSTKGITMVTSQNAHPKSDET